MSTAAIIVFPRPVGRHTSVFFSSACLTIDTWYDRGGMFDG